MALPSALGRLRRVERLGSGGFATVWLYHDPELDSLVAVKALADNWAARADIRERFLTEARLLRRADSDHVVRVHDLGETDDGTPYFVMTYADRGTVADLLADGPVEAGASLDVVRQAAAGIARLHAMGILHRDVKPQNLLLKTDHDGSTRLMVADLGVAKALVQASGITQVVGTPAYMAPEQADPAAGLDERCDVHALGAVAYHLLTGRRARSGGVESLFDPTPVPAASSHLDTLSREVDAVLLRAVAHAREDRWSSVDELASALATSLGDPAPPAPDPAPAGVSAEDRPTVLGVRPRPVAAEAEAEAARPTGGSGRLPGRRLVGAGVVGLALVAAIVGGAMLAPDGGTPTDDTTQASGEATPSAASERALQRVSLASDLGPKWEVVDRGNDAYKYDQAGGLGIVADSGGILTSASRAAQVELARLGGSSGIAGFALDYSRPLADQHRDGWPVGWEMRYSGTTEQGVTTYFWRWYVGRPGEVAGWVEAQSGITKTQVDDATAAMAEILDFEVPFRGAGEPSPSRSGSVRSASVR